MPPSLFWNVALAITRSISAAPTLISMRWPHAGSSNACLANFCNAAWRIQTFKASQTVSQTVEEAAAAEAAAAAEVPEVEQTPAVQQTPSVQQTPAVRQTNRPCFLLFDFFLSPHKLQFGQISFSFLFRQILL